MLPFVLFIYIDPVRCFLFFCFDKVNRKLIETENKSMSDDDDDGVQNQNK